MENTKQTVLKKKAKQLCCILLAAILCMGMTVSVMAASSKYNAAVSSYKKYMRGKRGSYKIVDVDGNGIPELLMHNSSAGINEVRIQSLLQSLSYNQARAGKPQTFDPNE